MDKVETKIRSVKNTVDYHIPNEDKIPYHEKYPNNYIKIKVIDDNRKKKELKLLKYLMNQMK